MTRRFPRAWWTCRNWSGKVFATSTKSSILPTPKSTESWWKSTLVLQVSEKNLLYRTNAWDLVSTISVIERLAVRCQSFQSRNYNQKKLLMIEALGLKLPLRVAAVTERVGHVTRIRGYLKCILECWSRIMIRNWWFRRWNLAFGCTMYCKVLFCGLFDIQILGKIHKF